MVARRRRTRGAAYTEVLMVLGSLLLIWAGASHLRAGYARRLQALSNAETGAWKRTFARDCRAGAADGEHVSEQSTLNVKTTRTGTLRLAGTVSAGAYFRCNEGP